MSTLSGLDTEAAQAGDRLATETSSRALLLRGNVARGRLGPAPSAFGMPGRSDAAPVATTTPTRSPWGARGTPGGPRRTSSISMLGLAKAKHLAARRRKKQAELLAAAPEVEIREPEFFDYGAAVRRGLRRVVPPCAGRLWRRGTSSRCSRCSRQRPASVSYDVAVIDTPGTGPPSVHDASMLGGVAADPEPQNGDLSGVAEQLKGGIVYTFNPDSSAKSTWDWIIVVMVLFNALVVPFELAFDPLFARTTAFSVADTVVDFCFFMDILVTLNTSVSGSWGKLNHSHWQIFTKYLRGLLIVDIIAVVPFNTLVTWFGGNTDLGFVRMMKLVRLLRLGRLLKKMDQLSSASALRVVKLLFGFLLLSHCLGCVWYMVSESLLTCYHDPLCDHAYTPNEIWVSQAVAWDPSTTTTRHKYTVSLFFMLTTMTTVGYGDTHPMNDAERSFACALLLVASVAYAVIFGSVAVQIQEFDKTNIRYQERMDAINEFFKLNHLPASLRERTRMYIDSLWALNRGINYDAVLGELPRTIRQEIMMTMHAKLVALVPVFKKASKAFVKALVMELKPQVALPGDYIVREGENAEFMAFLHSGAVAAHSKSNPDKVLMYKGVFFGEEVLLTADPTVVLRRTKSVQAASLCHLYILHRTDFRRVIQSFPEFFTMMKQAAERKLEVAALRVRLREVFKAQEAKQDDLADDDPRAVARRLAYLNDNPEAVLAATIMQRGWRYFKHIMKHGWSYKLELAHRMRQEAVYRKLHYAMKHRQLSTVQAQTRSRSHGTGRDAYADAMAAAKLRHMPVEALKHQATTAMEGLDVRVRALRRSQHELKEKLLQLQDTITGAAGQTAS